MEQKQKLLIGSWIQALGTVIAAISSTPSIPKMDEYSKSLDFIGNTLQATGNALEADGEEPQSYGRIGNQIQAIGNLTVISGLYLNEENLSIPSEKFFISGNLFQALGGVVSLGSEFGGGYNFYAVNGNLLSATGNSLQALGGAKKKAGEINSEAIITIGSWIQAIGSILIAIGISKEQEGKEKYGMPPSY
ncbi:hypothetical protein JOC95_004330 [Bacillus tianshenii]|uniref:Uncharacterized protein n=1 Tax=Sutcliffiella tianshenii TaxID=1463404 RepID=A0ABS2P678_9BACI|nr:hypothetical protein [Bacillus tianshenii]MBM7622413.1 hypothetical protein [Bacillus tianshenii]